MRRAAVLLALISLCPIVSIAPTQAQQHGQDPEYAKWGKVALEEVKKKYQVNIVDYLHVCKQTISPTTAKEVFKLWVKGNGQEFGVYVTITFVTATEKVLSVQFRETDH